MTDRETAAGLVERLNSRAEFEDNGGCCDRQLEDVGALLREAATTIRAQAAELERVGKERDALETNYDNGTYVAKLRDLHRRASEETGELLARAIKAEKERDQFELHYEEELAQRVENAARALKAEKENNGLRVIVSKMTNALPSGAYCSPEASLEFMAHLPDEVLLCTSKLVEDKAKAEALVAEAVRVLGGLGVKPSDGPLESILWGDMPEETLGTLSVQLKHLRAARAFIGRAKESGP